MERPSVPGSGLCACGIGLTRGGLLVTTELGWPEAVTGANCGVHPIATQAAAYQDA